MENTNPHNYGLVIGTFVAGLLVGGIAGYYYGAMKVPATAPTEQTAATQTTSNPYTQIETNPYNNVKVNPFQ